MKKWSGSIAVLAFLFLMMVLRYGLIENPLAERTLRNSVSYNSSNIYHATGDELSPAIHYPANSSQVISADSFVSGLHTSWNLSTTELLSMQTWDRLKHLVRRAQGLPQAVEAVNEAQGAWKSLMESVMEEKRLASTNGSSHKGGKQKQCPYSIRKMNVSEPKDNGLKLKIPCGLTQGSSITIIGTPSGLLGNFRIDLTGPSLPGEPDPPVVLHYNVRLHGDKLTEDPVIVQNTWTLSQDWGAEKRCPSPDDEDRNGKVDDLSMCNEMVGKEHISRRYPIKKEHSDTNRKKNSLETRYFPFKQGHLAVATIRVGNEGIQMTVDGKHVTSFAFRESLEPWLVSEVRISGDLEVISVLASGLPTSEDIDHAVDIDLLKSVPVPLHKPVDLFIGVFSTANNFKRRMAIRRTWLQYDVVRSGAVVIRFFAGLHKNQIVNEELWNEARTYGDIQLMPFVDYYSLITWKTLAICIYGTDVVSAKYVMKTDDDAFVRVDEVISSLKSTNLTHGLLYGLINSEAQPHRDPESKWYITPQEWPHEKYPPWAHGPGYVVSRDIARTVNKLYKKGELKMFKLEDVAMGIWISEMQKNGLEVKYWKEGRIYTEGCEAGYVIAHYQSPRDMLCLWQRLQETNRATCCGDRR